MKKIMFNDRFGLTDAVLKGHKTMTRRIARFDETERPCQKGRDKCLYCEHYDRENGCKWLLDYSPYKVGEVLAVAQAYKDLDYTLKGFATNPDRTCGIRREFAKKQAGWYNKMFVSAKFMPRRIRITDIKVERLQNISDEDIMKEGITYIAGGGYGVRFGGNYNVFALNPMVAFAALIDKISGKGTWNKNPYVFAYTLELIK